MSVTITQVRRAVEEAKEAKTAATQGDVYCLRPTVRLALDTILGDPTALTLIANSINQKLGADLVVKPSSEWEGVDMQGGNPYAGTVKPTDREIAENLQAMLNGKPQPHVRDD